MIVDVADPERPGVQVFVVVARLKVKLIAFRSEGGIAVGDVIRDEVAIDYDREVPGFGGWLGMSCGGNEDKCDEIQKRIAVRGEPTLRRLCDHVRRALHQGEA